MQLKEFLRRLEVGERVTFHDSMAAIAACYDYTPTRFINGNIVNEPGVNEGSCKLLYFAKLHGLTPEQTLALFGDYYWKDAIENPEAKNHPNIREFMKHGWAGIAFEGEALRTKDAT